MCESTSRLQHRIYCKKYIGKFGCTFGDIWGAGGCDGSPA